MQSRRRSETTTTDPVQPRRALNVVLLEDCDEDAWLVRRVLGRSRHFHAELVHVRTPQAAAEFCRDNPVDLLIADFWLGAENSLPLIAALGGRCGAVPALLLTGASDTRVHGRGLDAGFLHCLNKADLTPGSLDAAMCATLHTHEVERSLRDKAEAQHLGVRRLTRLLHDARLNLSETEETAEIRFARGDLRQCIDQACALAYETAGMPDDGTLVFRRPMMPVMIDADTVFLAEAISEYLAAALATRQPRATVEIDLRLAAGMAQVTISCADAGAGSAGCLEHEASSEQLFFANYVLAMHAGEVAGNPGDSRVEIILPLRAG